MVGKIVFCEEMVVHDCRKPCYKKPLVKPLEFGQWLCRKPSAGLIWAAPSGMQYAAAESACTARQAQATAAARWRNTTPLTPLLLYEPVGYLSVSAMILICTYSLLPAKSLRKAPLFVLYLVQTRNKERCGSCRWLINLQPCYDNCIADVTKRP